MKHCIYLVADAGLPGALPLISEDVIKQAIKTSLSLHGQVY